MNTDKSATLQLFNGKFYRVQETKGWKYIIVTENGKRKRLGLSTLQNHTAILKRLETVEGWEALCQRQLKSVSHAK